MTYIIHDKVETLYINTQQKNVKHNLLSSELSLKFLLLRVLSINYHKVFYLFIYLLVV